MIMQSLYEALMQEQLVKTLFWFCVNFCCKGLVYLEQQCTVTNATWIAFYIRYNYVYLVLSVMTFQTRLKNSRKPTQPRIKFDLEKLNDPTVMSAFQATIGSRFAPLATLVDEDADLDSMVTHFNKPVTDTAAELLGKQRRKRKPWVTSEILDLCDQIRDQKKKRSEPEGAKDYREIKRKR